MAIVPVELIGTIRTKNGQPLNNFTLYVMETQHQIFSYANQNAQTTAGRNTIISILENHITNPASGHVNGSITSSSIVVNGSNGHISISIIGTGNNAADHWPCAVFTNDTWENFDSHVIGLKFLETEVTEIIECPTCKNKTIQNCQAPVFEMSVANGNYTAKVIDNTSGCAYTQTIYVTNGVFEWGINNSGGIFNLYSNYTITLLDANGDPISWVENGISYNCINFTFEKITETT